MNVSPPAKTSLFTRIKEWAFSSNTAQAADGAEAMSIDWVKAVPYAGIHLACLGVIWVGWSWPALIMAIFFYALRVFTLTGFYHRYFAHRAFKVGRITQFVFG